MNLPRETEQPCPAFTREELTYLQELMDGERAGWFNFYMETLEDGFLSESESSAWAKYKLAKSVRDKVYHLNGRDTLALQKGSQQRHWDQQHDY